MTMVDDSTFQNIAARMLIGHYAYQGSTKLCLDKQQALEAGGGGDCAADLRDVIQGACNVNFVTMWYASAGSPLRFDGVSLAVLAR